MSINHDRYVRFSVGYEEIVRKSLNDVTDPSATPSWCHGEVSSVMNGLLARQATLTISLSENISIWNEHLAPLILRSMIDCLIMFRWIIKAPKQRSLEYINYGLGQAKLAISHLEKKADEDPEDDLPKRMIEFKEMWIESQRWMPFVDVNLGSWSGKSVRQMAIEAGDEDLYNFSFTPFSSCVHNQWDHVHVFNTQPCTNKLHKWHRRPFVDFYGVSDDYLFRSAKYFDLTVESLRRASGHDEEFRPARQFVLDNLTSIYNLDEEEATKS